MLLSSKGTNTKDRILKNIIDNNNLYLFNRKSQIHIDSSSATYSVIDFTFCDTSIFPRVSCRSNHFPIVINSLHLQEDDLPWRRSNKVNWEEFQSVCLKHLVQNNNS